MDADGAAVAAAAASSRYRMVWIIYLTGGRNKWRMRNLRNAQSKLARWPDRTDDGNERPAVRAPWRALRAVRFQHMPPSDVKMRAAAAAAAAASSAARRPLSSKDISCVRRIAPRQPLESGGAGPTSIALRGQRSKPTLLAAHAATLHVPPAFRLDPIATASEAGIRAFSTDVDVSSGGKDGKNNLNYTTHEQATFRAKIKLEALAEARTKRKEAKRAYEAARYDDEMLNDEESTAELNTLLDEWEDSERQLASTLQQAIKYVARTRDADAALTAQQLLEEMIERAGAAPTEFPLEGEDSSSDFGPNKLKIQAMVKMIISTPRQDRPSDVRKAPSTGTHVSNMAFPPPERKDFSNVLRSWHQSKARKKGLHAEALLLRMAELNHLYPDVFDTLPDSKTFAVVIQCHAGSTHGQSQKRIVDLNAIHFTYAQSNVQGVHRNDPFVLMASLKGLRNYRKKEEIELGEHWITRLFAFVKDPGNREYCESTVLQIPTTRTAPADESSFDNDEGANETVSSIAPAKQAFVNGSPSFTKHIRELAKLRGTDGAAAMARQTLDRMHEIAVDGNDSGIASMDIGENAYNLVIGLYRDSQEEGHATEAVFLLDEMIASWKVQTLNDPSSSTETRSKIVPFPSAQTFKYCIESLAYVKDTSTLWSESRRLLDEYELMCDKGDIEVSTKPYNATLESLVKCMRNDPKLLSRVSEVVARMNEMAERFPEIEPDVFSASMVLHACSFVTGDEKEKSVAFATAEGTFKELEQNELNGSEEHKMTDKCYFHMMRCIVGLCLDQEEKQEKIKKLFAGACSKGLCSADVLKAFRNSVSEEDFVATVGSGRLADNWIANVRSGKALYTDGTTGGKGKNARRKGKSTSDWAKKQRRREEELQHRKMAKEERRQKRSTQR